MPKSQKTVAETYTLMTEIVLPNDTNPLGNLMGGKLLHWMDIAAAISAQRASNRICVTASVDSVDFKQAIKLGEIVILEARVTRSFNTSMEIRIDVYVESLTTGDRRHTNVAYYTFVAIDSSGIPIPAPEIVASTPQEQEWAAGALRRREVRLLLAGRIKPEDAAALQKLFE